jgi:hypothetical protein
MSSPGSDMHLDPKDGQTGEQSLEPTPTLTQRRQRAHLFTPGGGRPDDGGQLTPSEPHGDPAALSLSDEQKPQNKERMRKIQDKREQRKQRKQQVRRQRMEEESGELDQQQGQEQKESPVMDELENKMQEVLDMNERWKHKQEELDRQWEKEMAEARAAVEELSGARQPGLPPPLEHQPPYGASLGTHEGGPSSSREIPSSDAIKSKRQLLRYLNQLLHDSSDDSQHDSQHDSIRDAIHIVSLIQNYSPLVPDEVEKLWGAYKASEHPLHRKVVEIVTSSCEKLQERDDEVRGMLLDLEHSYTRKRLGEHP